MTTNPTVALLGTGTMGAGMAANIARAGLPLRVWNRSREKAEPLAGVGAVVADSPAEAVGARTSSSPCSSTPTRVAATMEQARASLAPGAVWVQQSTVGVEGSDRLVALAEDLGIAYVDAPVLGTRKPARGRRAGRARVRAGGRPRAGHPGVRRDRLPDVVAGRGRRGVTAEAGRERLGDHRRRGDRRVAGPDPVPGPGPPPVPEAVAGGAMDAPYVQLKGTAMLEGDFAPSFSLDGAAKDGDLIVAAARGAGVELAVRRAARDHLARARAAGHGGQDLSATYLEH